MHIDNSGVIFIRGNKMYTLYLKNLSFIHYLGVHGKQ